MIKKLSSDEVITYKADIYKLMQIDFINTYGFEAERQFVESKIETLPDYIINEQACVYGTIDTNLLSSFIWAYPLMTPNGTVMHVAYIAVGEDDRNKGLGSKLIEAIEKEAFKQGIKSVELIVGANNTIARSFYKKNNYTEERLVLKKMIHSDGEEKMR